MNAAGSRVRPQREGVGARLDLARQHVRRRSPAPRLDQRDRQRDRGQRRRACRAAAGRSAPPAACTRNVPAGATIASQASPRSRSSCFWWPSSCATTVRTSSRAEVVDQVVVEHHPLAVPEPDHVGVRRARPAAGVHAVDLAHVHARPGRPARAPRVRSWPCGQPVELVEDRVDHDRVEPDRDRRRRRSPGAPRAPTSGAGSGARAPWRSAPPIAAVTAPMAAAFTTSHGPVRPGLRGEADVERALRAARRSAAAP